MTLASLFDGSGGFPLAGILAGITPLWASEIEPFPIRVTTKRLLFMKHYGDVSKINGAEVDPVDIITFGSPCQDLSVAGKREGIEQGQRSSLFFEAIRIIKEMRGATNGRYPTIVVWENVPGALSSGGGRTSDESSKKSAASKKQTYQFLDLRSGATQEKSWATVSASHGGCSTRNIGEFPSVENVSTLSEILQVNVPEKYYLSPRACEGILRRASRRGKELPAILKQALDRQARVLTETSPEHLTDTTISDAEIVGDVKEMS